MVLLQGTFDDVVIGEHVPGPAYFTNITVDTISAPLVGAANGLLQGIVLGPGLAMSGNVLHVVFPDEPRIYGKGLYGKGPYGIVG
jgi:hypothetical protein